MRRIKGSLLDYKVHFPFALFSLLILDLGKPACPVGWFLNGFSCYKASEHAKPWSNAKMDCHASGGYLMKIDDALEQQFLEVYLVVTGINQAAKVSMQICRNVNAGYRWTMFNKKLLNTTERTAEIKCCSEVNIETIAVIR